MENRLVTHVRRHPILYSLGAVILAILIVLRLYFGLWLTHYVNRSLYNMDGYRGSVEDVNIDLYRGAYRIDGLKINKLQGKFPVPFLQIQEVDFSVHWGALLHGRIVSKVRLSRPILNFAIDKTGTERQTGSEVDWTKSIKDLMPVDINEVKITDGKITYRDFSSTPKVDIYINNLNGQLENLRNVVEKNGSLPSTVHFKGDSIGDGTLQINGKINILKEVPDFDLDGKLENTNLTALNDYTDAYAALDFSKGKLSVYSQMVLKDEQLSGYVKPIASDVSVIDMQRKLNPLKLAWESLAAGIIEIFTNHGKDQFGTKVEISGNLHNVKTGVWSAIGGVVSNAFIKALDKKIDQDVKY